MSESITLTREELAELVRREVATQSRHGTALDPFAGMPEAVTPRRSFPDTPESEMEQMAKMRGGVWLGKHNIHEYKKCVHAHPDRCDRCWTRETEARWAYALGLSDVEPIGLDLPEERASQ